MTPDDPAAPGPPPETASAAPSEPVVNPPPPAPAAAPTAHVPAGQSPRAWTLLVVVTALALGIDLITKWAAFRWVADAPFEVIRDEVVAVTRFDPGRIGTLVPRHEPVAVIPGALEFTLVLNPGAVFGIGAGQRWFFIVFTGLAMAFAVTMFARWTTARDRASHVAIALLMAGGLGNLYDRWFFACVRDFIHPLPGLHWPGGLKLTGASGEVWPYVSNVADLFLIVGIVVLAFRLWRPRA